MEEYTLEGAYECTVLGEEHCFKCRKRIQGRLFIVTNDGGFGNFCEPCANFLFPDSEFFKGFKH